jgi:hypothetical protein
MTSVAAFLTEEPPSVTEKGNAEENFVTFRLPKGR